MGLPKLVLSQRIKEDRSVRPRLHRETPRSTAMSNVAQMTKWTRRALRCELRNAFTEGGKRRRWVTIVAWPIETGARELDARLLFGLRCTLSGFSFISGTKNAVTEVALGLKRSAYVHKSAAPKQHKRFTALVRSGATVYVHDEEGLNNRRDKFVNRLGSDSVRHVTRYFTFGENQKRELVAMQPNIGAISVVGHPVYDLLRGKLSSFYRMVAREKAEAFGRYIVVAPSHSDAVAQRLQTQVAQAFLARGVVDTVVLKPHPGKSGQLPDTSSGFVVADQREPIGPLVLGSSGLLHYRSTVAVAAALVNVPALDFAPDEDRWLDQRLFGTSVTKLPAVDQAFGLIGDETPCPTETRDLLHIDDEPASDRILHTIYHDGAEPAGETRIRRGTRRFVPIPTLASLSPHGRMKAGSMAPRSVEERLSAMADCLGMRTPPIRFFGDAAFLMHP